MKNFFKTKKTSSSAEPDAGLTCKELDSFLVDYLDGQLPNVQLQRFESHLLICPACDTYLAGYKKTIEKGVEALDSEASGNHEEIPDSLVEAILAARNRRV